MAGGHYRRLPFKVSGFQLALGPEICRDWITPREGHGFPISEIANAWKSIAQHPDLFKPSTAQGNMAFELNRKRLVTNAGRTTVITYFETPYGT